MTDAVSAQIAALERLKGRWMTGGTAQEVAPAPWRTALAEDPAPELGALALAAQMHCIAMRPSPSADVPASPDLPRLSLPPLPDALRPRFRRILSVAKPGPEAIAALIALMAGRGFSVHPADHFPRPGPAPLPDLYAPWLDWSETGSTARHAALDAESWDEFAPMQRLLKLRALRRDSPDAARALLQDKLDGEAADQRLKLLGELTQGLGPDDIPFLEGLRSDRSQKVRALVDQYLARLGQLTDCDKVAAELADFLTVGRAGMLSRRKAVSARKLKTSAQGARRFELFRSVALADLARALELSASELVEAWTTAEGNALDGFAAMVAATGSDADVARLLQRSLDAGAHALPAVQTLLTRCTDAERNAILPRIVRLDTERFDATRAAQPVPGTLPGDALNGTSAMTALLDLAHSAARSGEGKPDLQRLRTGLTNIALILDAPAAGALLARLTDTGLSSSDPDLMLLAFNAALPKGIRP